jgi:hypothetical protein
MAKVAFTVIIQTKEYGHALFFILEPENKPRFWYYKPVSELPPGLREAEENKLTEHGYTVERLD